MGKWHANVACIWIVKEGPQEGCELQKWWLRWEILMTRGVSEACCC
jgi:hypothetical protein